MRFGGFVQDRYLFAKDVVRFEGEIVAGVAALTEEIASEAARLIEIEYEPLPVVTDFVAAMEPDAPLIHPDLESYGKDENIVVERQHDGLPHDREGRRRRRDGDRRRDREGPVRLRCVPGRADRAARGRRAVAGRQGHHLVVDAGAVRRARRRRANARDPRVGRARRRAACSAAASARSAICTSRRRSRRSRERRGDRSASCSPARRSSR